MKNRNHIRTTEDLDLADEWAAGKVAEIEALKGKNAQLSDALVKIRDGSFVGMFVDYEAEDKLKKVHSIAAAAIAEAENQPETP
jgi:hypothetical protein